MERNEAVLIIRNLAESLRAQPNQFLINIEANVKGAVFSSYGGSGAVFNTTGGGPGSNTTGLNSSARVSGGDFDLISDASNAAKDQRMKDLAQALAELAGQLESEKPDNGVVDKIVGSLKESWIPPLVSTVVTTVVGLLLK
ncbi:hypothetical protein ABWL43_10025 [Pseudomonas sp. HT11]|uniref:hypothetical protein n=1 Tax=Pseudomonas sp. HT11 TaxID=3230490 RepID=UPI00384E1480